MTADRALMMFWIVVTVCYFVDQLWIAPKRWKKSKEDLIERVLKQWRENVDKIAQEEIERVTRVHWENQNKKFDI